MLDPVQPLEYETGLLSIPTNDYERVVEALKVLKTDQKQSI